MALDLLLERGQCLETHPVEGIQAVYKPLMHRCCPRGHHTLSPTLYQNRSLPCLPFQFDLLPDVLHHLYNSLALQHTQRDYVIPYCSSAMQYNFNAHQYTSLQHPQNGYRSEPQSLGGCSWLSGTLTQYREHHQGRWDQIPGQMQHFEVPLHLFRNQQT